MNIVKFDDQIEYHNDLGQWHRIDRPAVEYTNGGKFWYQNNQLHRLDGHAAEYVNGTKIWFQNNQLHRLDGPAIEWADGRQEYYIHGRKYTELEFKFFSRVILTDTSDS